MGQIVSRPFEVIVQEFGPVGGTSVGCISIGVSASPAIDCKEWRCL